MASSSESQRKVGMTGGGGREIISHTQYDKVFSALRGPLHVFQSGSYVIPSAPAHMHLVQESDNCSECTSTKMMEKWGIPTLQDNTGDIRANRQLSLASSPMAQILVHFPPC